MRYAQSSRGVILTFALATCLSVAAASLQPAEASRPVRKTIVGCVTNGVFTSNDGYVIKVRQTTGGSVDLSRWQHKRLRITGNLLPGDNFYLTAAPVVIGTCR